jgi:type II secretory ATPase GspE/PulE/Tfp pilus assembly ATPase PilB-like protein
MVAGTFNVVMAQRLIRRLCTQCCHNTSIKDTKQRKDAVDAFRGLEPEVLKSEILSRNIAPDQWRAFITDGTMMM